MPGVINGGRWIAERLKVLRERLVEEIPTEERQAIEAEIETLSKESGIGPSGLRLPRFLRLPRR